MQGRLKCFVDDRKGAVAIMFAVALLVVILAAGAAIDIGRGVSVASQLQQAVDAATLAAARETDQSKQKTVFQQVLAANAVLTGGATVVVGSEKLQQTGKRVVGSAEARMTTAFMRLVNQPIINIEKSAAVGVASKSKIALVLDVSSSMIEENRFAPMQSAAAEFVSELSNGLLTEWEVSIVPFSSRINVGLTNTDFLRSYNGAPAVPNRWVNPHNYYGSNYSRINWIDGTSFAMYNGANYYWMGCVEPRIDFALHAGGNISDALSDENPSGHQFVAMDANDKSGKSFCPPPIVPLTSDASTLSTAIAALTSQGSTRLDAGMLGGWYALSQKWASSWSGGVPPGGNGNTQKIVVFMTDGRMNTQDKPAGKNFDWICEAASDCDDYANDTLLSICTAMKNQNITIYTVAYDQEADQQFIKSCASSNEYFKEAVSTSGGSRYIVDVYQNIAKSIATASMALVE